MFGPLLQTPIGRRQKLQEPSRLQLIPALTVIVFMRRRIGGRMLNMLWVIPMAAALYLIQPFSGRSVDDYSLRIFAVAFVAAAILHRVHLEYVKHRGGELWHSYSRGTSWLSFLPLPTLVIQVLIDPALCGYAGWKVFTSFSPWLGFWLIVGAISLWGTEFHDYRHSYHRNWDIRDGEVEGRVQSEAMMRGRGDAPGWSEGVATSRRPRGRLLRWLRS